MKPPSESDCVIQVVQAKDRNQRNTTLRPRSLNAMAWEGGNLPLTVGMHDTLEVGS